MYPLNPADPMVVMGRVAAAHGIRGWIKIQPFTEYIDSLLDFPTWWVARSEQGPWQAVKVKQCEAHSKVLVALLPDCPDRNHAEKLKGLLIAVPRSELPEQSEDEYYWTDLIGLNVVTLSGDSLGVISNLLETGANDVLVIKHAEGELLVPFVSSVIQQVDIANRLVKVDWERDYLS